MEFFSNFLSFLSTKNFKNLNAMSILIFCFLEFSFILLSVSFTPLHLGSLYCLVWREVIKKMLNNKFCIYHYILGQRGLLHNQAEIKKCFVFGHLARFWKVNDTKNISVLIQVLLYSYYQYYLEHELLKKTFSNLIFI